MAERAATRYEEVNGCWVSTYSVGSHGYAQIGWQLGEGTRTATTVHRAAWVYHHGPIPDEQTVDHTCKTRTCVRPEHWRLLSNLDNARRTYGRDWPLGQCVRGHSEEYWCPRSEDRIKGYCAECRRNPRGRPCSDSADKVERGYASAFAYARRTRDNDLLNKLNTGWAAHRAFRATMEG